MDLSQYTESQLAEWYINNRNWLADRKADYEALIADVEKTQDGLETEMQKRLNAADATSFRTKGGTIVSSDRVTYNVEDRAAFGNFIIINGAWEATQLRPTKDFIEDYIREHNGQLPAGVAAYIKKTISVKKPTK